MHIKFLQTFLKADSALCGTDVNLLPAQDDPPTLLNHFFYSCHPSLCLLSALSKGPVLCHSIPTSWQALLCLCQQGKAGKSWEKEQWKVLVRPAGLKAPGPAQQSRAQGAPMGWATATGDSRNQPGKCWVCFPNWSHLIFIYNFCILLIFSLSKILVCFSGFSISFKVNLINI